MTDDAATAGSPEEAPMPGPTTARLGARTGVVPATELARRSDAATGLLRKAYHELGAKTA